MRHKSHPQNTFEVEGELVDYFEKYFAPSRLDVKQRLDIDEDELAEHLDNQFF